MNKQKIIINWISCWISWFFFSIFHRYFGEIVWQVTHSAENSHRSITLVGKYTGPMFSSCSSIVNMHMHTHSNIDKLPCIQPSNCMLLCGRDDDGDCRWCICFCCRFQLYAYVLAYLTLFSTQFRRNENCGKYKYNHERNAFYIIPKDRQTHSVWILHENQRHSRSVITTSLFAIFCSRDLSANQWPIS